MLWGGGYTNLKNKRYSLFDNMRGIVIFLAVIESFISSMEIVPAWIKHVPHGVTLSALYFSDIGVIGFLTVLSLLYSYNFHNKLASKSKSSVYRFYFNKAFILIGIGFAIDLIERILDAPSIAGIAEFMLGWNPFRWNILVAYGFAVFTSLPFIRLRKEFRLALGFVLLVFYQFVILSNSSLSPSILSNDQGGPLAIPAWLGLLLIISAVGDSYFQNKKQFRIIACALVLLGGFILLMNLLSIPQAPTEWNYVNKWYCTPSYMLAALAICMAIFMIMDLIKYFHKKTIPVIGWMGQNSIFFFLWSAMAATGIKALLGNEIAKTPTLPQLVLALIIYLPFLIIPAWIFYKKNIKISI